MNCPRKFLHHTNGQCEACGYVGPLLVKRRAALRSFLLGALVAAGAAIVTVAVMVLTLKALSRLAEWVAQ